MGFLSEQDRQRITEAVRRAEQHTSGELVTVVARQSDDYLYIPTLWAALLALVLPALLTVTGLQIPNLTDYEAQVALFVALAALFRIPTLKMALVPREIRRRRAALAAREQFLEQNLHSTVGRTGVLLFVSVAERHVELIADQGINEVVPPGTWERLVANLVVAVRNGQIADGFEQAIDECGRMLAEHFPIEAGDRNELPDHLVEL